MDCSCSRRLSWLWTVAAAGGFPCYELKLQQEAILAMDCSCSRRLSWLWTVAAAGGYPGYGLLRMAGAISYVTHSRSDSLPAIQILDGPGENIESSQVWGTSCLAELIYDLINSNNR